jgi:TonB family protein
MLIGANLGRSRRAIRLMLVAAAIAASACFSAKSAFPQTHEQNASDRKIVTRIEPEYPETLKRLYIGGVVRVEVVVGSNGAVQTTELLGGNPILGQSAMKAIKQWKYTPAGSKEKLVMQLEFDPHR